MSKDWINTYGSKAQPRSFQMGGEMAPPAEPGMEQGGGAPDLEGMLAEYAQSRDPQLAVAIADALVEMMAAQAGGGAPAGGAPMAKHGTRMSSRTPIFRA